MSLTLTKEQAKFICWGDKFEDIEVIVEGDWVNEGKYQLCTHIISKDDKFYSATFDRAGSYHTDWHFQWDWDDDYTLDCPEVEQIEIVKTVWRPVNKEAKQ